MIRRTGKVLSVSLIVTLFLLSCNSNLQYTESAEMKGNIWELMNTPVFRVPVDDTTENNNIYFTIRSGSDYPFRNIFLFVTATSPDGRTITDTLQYYLADDRGKRYGKGFGDIHELKVPYRTNVFFPIKGEYTFIIRHGMRKEKLPGIYDIGIRIEKTGK